MSNETVNKTRRTFLKGAAYTSALSVAGVSSLAFVLNKNKDKLEDKTASFNKGKVETVYLLNNSDQTITLDASFPVIIERVEGTLTAKPNLIDANSNNGMVMMMPHQRISFEVQTKNGVTSGVEIADISKLYDQQLQMTSIYPTFNTVIPVINVNGAMA